MNEMKNLLQKIIGLCYEISTTTVIDVFFTYFSHVNAINVFYYTSGWSDNSKLEYPIYIASVEKITKENLQNIIKELEKLRKDASKN